MDEETWYKKNGLTKILYLENLLKILYKYMENSDFFKKNSDIDISGDIAFIEDFLYSPYKSENKNIITNNRVKNREFKISRYGNWESVPKISELKEEERDEILDIESSNNFFYIDILVYSRTRRLPSIKDCIKFCMNYIHDFNLLEIEKCFLESYEILT